ncbi:hypothetical protein GCM10009775_04970 [Microbacterium aoyamense]|uniref:HTH tetR-type domain-containing protein n=1 Tax=Microbacterium aoyamense TaxID=344166 RepID=A0ABN2P9N6_9MICO
MRNVAARAGVGASTLRHYFPTQRALFDAALTQVYVEAMPDERISDTTVPARDRLVQCLIGLLEPFSNETQARRTWQALYETFIAPEATDAARQGYLVIARQAEHRIESWLSILEAEGALPPGDTRTRLHLLMIVVDGLSLDRAFPELHSREEVEASTLRLAVDAVFGAGGERLTDDSPGSVSG